METGRRLITASFIYKGVLYVFNGVVGIENIYPYYEKVAIGLRCMVSNMGNFINDDTFEAFSKETESFHYMDRKQNEDGSITYFIDSSLIELSIQDSEEFYTENYRWCKEQIEDTLGRFL